MQEYGPQTSQRIATVLVYLTDVEEGGETIFKREGFGSEYTSTVVSHVLYMFLRA